MKNAWWIAKAIPYAEERIIATLRVVVAAGLVEKCDRCGWHYYEHYREMWLMRLDLLQNKSQGGESGGGVHLWIETRFVWLVLLRTSWSMLLALLHGCFLR